MHPATLEAFTEELEKIAAKKDEGSAAGSVAGGAAIGAGAMGAGIGAYGAGKGLGGGIRRIKNYRSIKRLRETGGYEFKIGTKDKVHAFENRYKALNRPKNIAKITWRGVKSLGKDMGKGVKGAFKNAPKGKLLAGAAAAGALGGLAHHSSKD